MTQREHEEMAAILEAQFQRVSTSPEAAEELLTRLGIMHLLVDQEEETPPEQ